eukprot:TRINITY_DN4063_c0_g1_i2.p1 TRINITY_DN4063_c0_g1~~TRINITY_DN4063_c0_g1_i2.p1  ORF type:complete len:265 (-),score=28.34 TRINITY_DN4063_c0_g1_i2:27-821(-)
MDESSRSTVKSFVDASLRFFRMDVIYRVVNHYRRRKLVVKIVSMHDNNVNYQTIELAYGEEKTVNGKMDSLFKITPFYADSAAHRDIADVYIRNGLDRYFVTEADTIKSDYGDYCRLSQLKERTLEIRHSNTEHCQLKSYTLSLRENDSLQIQVAKLEKENEALRKACIQSNLENIALHVCIASTMQVLQKKLEKTEEELQKTRDKIAAGQDLKALEMRLLIQQYCLVHQMRNSPTASFTMNGCTVEGDVSALNTTQILSLIHI